MFEVDLDEQVTVDWPVTINVPKDGGTVKSFKVTVRFQLLDSRKLRGVDADAPAKPTLREHVKGWGDEFVVKGTGEPLPFTADNLDALLAKPYIQRAFTIGLIEASSGAAAKNS